MDTKRLGQREASASTSLTAPRRHTGRTVDAATLLCFFLFIYLGMGSAVDGGVGQTPKNQRTFLFPTATLGLERPPATRSPPSVPAGTFLDEFPPAPKGWVGLVFARARLARGSGGWNTRPSRSVSCSIFSFFFRFLRPESLADVAGGGAAGGRVRPRWTWLENWVLLRFTGLFGGFTRIYLVLPTFYWVSPSCTGFYRVLPSFAGFYRVLTAFYCFFRVGTRFYLVLLGFTGFYRVSTRFYRVLFGFTEIRRVLLGFSEF